jgi:hypothetical protein
LGNCRDGPGLVVVRVSSLMREGCAEGVRGDARSVDMEVAAGIARSARIHHSGPTIG